MSVKILVDYRSNSRVYFSWEDESTRIDGEVLADVRRSLESNVDMSPQEIVSRVFDVLRVSYPTEKLTLSICYLAQMDPHLYISSRIWKRVRRSRFERMVDAKV